MLGGLVQGQVRAIEPFAGFVSFGKLAVRARAYLANQTEVDAVILYTTRKPQQLTAPQIEHLLRCPQVSR